VRPFLQELLNVDRRTYERRLPLPQCVDKRRPHQGFVVETTGNKNWYEFTRGTSIHWLRGNSDRRLPATVFYQMTSIISRENLKLLDRQPVSHLHLGSIPRA